MKSLIIFLILIYNKAGHSYPTGAPAAACDSMIPGHNVASQICQSQYTIQSDKSVYNTNDIIRITVRGSTNSDTFEGVLLIAKTPTSQQIIGTWSPVNSSLQTLDCGGTANTGITHTSKAGKSEIEAIWYPPSTIIEQNTIIKATIVKSFSVIYVDCFSVTLSAKQSNQSTNGTITTTAASNISPTTTVPQTSDVSVNISWTYSNGVTAVQMQINNLQTSQWLAMGLSLDEEMGEDHVFVCQHLADNTIALKRLINPSGTSPPVPASTMSNPGGTLNITLQKLENGIAYCQFTLSNFSNSKRRRRQSGIVSLTQSTSYHPLIASGNLDSSNAMIKHTSRTALSQIVQLNQQETISYNLQADNFDQTNLMKAHGIIMIFAWLLLVSTGILVARYFKKSWPETKICGKAIWFAVHRVIMTSVALLTIIAFILILVYEKGKWISRDDPQEFAHSIIGIIVICFAIIQPIMGLFRCQPDGEYRFIYNYAHATVGFSAFILSIVAIFLAIFFTQFNFRITKQWGILVAWTCWIPIIFLIFSFIEFYFQKYSTPVENVDSYNMNDPSEHSTLRREPIRTRDNIKQDRIKGIFLAIHIIVALVLTIALATLVGRQ